MILIGDAYDQLSTLPTESVQCCVTSPPYWGLRDYGVEGQLGLESTPEAYVGAMRMIFEQVRRVLKKDGTLWLNLGDCWARNGGTQGGGNRARLHMEGVQKRMLKVPKHSGLKPKDLVGMPWRIALALQADGWYLRQDIIWHKPNVIPESVKDRPVRSHEYIFLLTKAQKYFYNGDAIREPYATGSIERLKRPMQDTNGRLSIRQPGRKYQVVNKTYQPNPLGRAKRSVWTIPTRAFKDAHFATLPPALVEPCILAGSRPGDVVLDPFFGSGTVGLIAKKHGREFVGIELNPAYAEMARKRIGTSA